jgi:hypothetical protein
MITSVKSPPEQAKPSSSRSQADTSPINYLLLIGHIDLLRSLWQDYFACEGKR